MHSVWAETLRSNKAELGLRYIWRTVRARCKRTMRVRDKNSWDDEGVHCSLLSGYQSNNMWMCFNGQHGWNKKEVQQSMWLEQEGSMIGVIRADQTCNVLTPRPGVTKNKKYQAWKLFFLNGREGHNGAQLGCIKTPVGKATSSKGEGVCKVRLLLLGWDVDASVRWQCCHLSSAAQSSSSLAGSHLLPSGPSPCHRTQYCIPRPRCRWSTILSMKNSCCPLIVIRSGGCSAHLGNSESLFSVNCFSSEVWNTGNISGLLGRSIVTVEWVSSMAITWYGPS